MNECLNWSIAAIGKYVCQLFQICFGLNGLFVFTSRIKTDGIIHHLLMLVGARKAYYCYR